MFIKSIGKATAILEAFEQDAASLSLSDLAHRTGMTIASAQRVTHTLTELGYLEKNPMNKQYRIGPRVLLLSRSYMRNVDLQRASEGPMQRLSEDTGLTVNVTVRSGPEILYILRIPSRDNVVIPTLWIGSTLPLHYTSMGRAILAHLPPPEREEALNQLSFPIATSSRQLERDELTTELHAIRQRGYAVNDRDLRPDLRSLGAPLFGHDGSCVAALGISARTDMSSLEELEFRLAPHLLAAAAAISRNLGLHPGSLPTP